MESSAFGRLIGVLVAPQKTFRSIAERPTWLVAFLVLALSPLLGGLVAKPKIDWEEVARHQIERSGADIPREAAEQQIEMTAKIGAVLHLRGARLHGHRRAALRARLLGRLHSRRRRAGLQAQPGGDGARDDADGGGGAALGAGDPRHGHHPARRARAGELPEVEPRRLRARGREHHPRHLPLQDRRLHDLVPGALRHRLHPLGEGQGEDGGDHRRAALAGVGRRSPSASRASAP